MQIAQAEPRVFTLPPRDPRLADRLAEYPPEIFGDRLYQSIELMERYSIELAVDLLTERQIEIEEISHFLGFSEPSSFYRAFRRWTGKTPQEYLQLPS